MHRCRSFLMSRSLLSRPSRWRPRLRDAQVGKGAIADLNTAAEKDLLGAAAHDTRRS